MLFATEKNVQDVLMILLSPSERPVSSNRAKGRDSFDATLGNSLVEFINRTSTQYPVEVGAPAFDLVPV